MNLYLDLDGHGTPVIWHNPDAFPFVPVPVISKLQVAPGYWDEVVRRLTATCPDCAARYGQHYSKCPRAVSLCEGCTQ